MKIKLRLSVVLLLVFALVMLVAVILAELTEMPVYSSPIVIGLLALLGLLTVASCFSKRWLTLKNCGFLIAHLAVVLFLISAFVWYVWGVTGVTTLYAGGNGTRFVYEVDKNGNVTANHEMPFAVQCDDFQIEYHPYKYTYSVVEGSGYVEKGKAELTENGLDCGKYGTVPVSEFYSEDGQMNTQIQYQSLLLSWDGQYPSVKQYHADISFSDGENARISVNNPASHKGWKIYLQSYSFEATDNGMNFIVTIQAKHDPASDFAILGLALCPIGTFLLCLRPRRVKRREGESNA